VTITGNGHRPDADFERTPPNDLAAERGVIGGMLLSKDAISDVAAWIRPADHYYPAHQIIHEAILELDAAGEPADAITVCALLLRSGRIARTGGADYLHTLIASVPTAAFAGDHARVVREHAILRRLIERCTRGIQLAYEGAGDAGEIAARVLAEVEAAGAPMGANGLPSFRETLEDTIGALESKAPRGIPLPWQDLNTLLLGLAPGQLVIVAARPGIGKSVVAADIAVHTAVGGDREPPRPVLFMSAEMSREEIATRILAARSRVNLHTLLSRNLTDSDWERVNGAYHRIGDAPLVLDDEPGPTAAHIQGRLREMDRTDPAGLLVVDYLQLMEAAKAESRQVAVADLGWQLKQIGRRRGIPVVVACQLNRQPELRADKRPQISDLRESGALEQHADVIILLHREDAYDPESVRAGEIDLIVGKNRQGPKATVTAAFQGHFSRVVDMAKEDPR
jgi:replicative DNA helicase